jgi:hypothetical protein
VDVADGVSANGKNALFIRRIENQLVARFFHALPAEVNGVASAKRIPSFMVASIAHKSRLLKNFLSVHR